MHQSNNNNNNEHFIQISQLYVYLFKIYSYTIEIKKRGGEKKVNRRKNKVVT